MKIIITGAKGYIAAHLARHLSGAGHAAELMDARDDAWMEREFWGADAVIHCAALVHQKNRPESEYTRVNARLTELLARKAKAEGVGAFIFMSTLAVYGLAQGHITGDTTPRAQYALRPQQVRCRAAALGAVGEALYGAAPALPNGLRA